MTNSEQRSASPEKAKAAAKKHGTKGSAREKKIGRDPIFRKIFSTPEYFVMFLRDFIKEDWAQGIDVEHLSLLPRRYTRLLRGERESDVVYKIAHPAFNGYLVALTEHQSRVDQLMPLRILDYMVCIWWEWVKTEVPKGDWRASPFKLPPIVPIVFYDGSEPWTAPRWFPDKVEFSAAFSRWTPHFEYQMVDLSEISFEALAACEDALSLCLMLDKAKTTEDFERLERLQTGFRETLLKTLENTRLRQVLNQVFQAFAQNAGTTRGAMVQWLTNYLEGKEPSMFQQLAENIKRDKAVITQQLAAEKIRADNAEKLAENEQKRAESERKRADEARRKGTLEMLTTIFTEKFHVKRHDVEFYLCECDVTMLAELSKHFSAMTSLADLKAVVERCSGKLPR